MQDNSVGHSKQSAENPYCLAYFKCYSLFYNNYGMTYHSMCLAREKLKQCKNIVLQANKAVLKDCDTGSYGGQESIADYWCNKTDGFHLYMQYWKCPYIPDVIPLYTDFSPQLHIQMIRSRLAVVILTSAGIEGYSLWQWGHNYSHPEDPVFKALNSIQCAQYKWMTHRNHITDKYCGGYVADTQWFFYTNISMSSNNHLSGLSDWHNSSCSSDIDPLQQMMAITQLGKYFNSHIQPLLGECHPNNVLVWGVSCLTLFYATSPPFSDLQQLLPSLCKGLNHLKTCWAPVVLVIRQI